MSGKWAGSEPMRADLLMVVWIVFPVVCVCWEFGFFLSNPSEVHQESASEPGHLQRLCVCACVCARALQVSGLSVMKDSASQMRFW